MPLEIGYIEEKEILKVIQRCHKPCPTIPPTRQNSFHPFDSILLAILFKFF